jgi:transcriptional regulator with XRE-family HTH domain
MNPAKLKSLRIQAGLTQEKLASEAGISCSSIVKYEAGRVPSPSYAHVAALAKVLSLFLGQANNKILLELTTEEVPA